MTGKQILSGCLGAALCVFALWGPESQAQTTNSSIAYVYVSSVPADGSNVEIQAFSAGSDGRLTPVPGSPFAFDDASLTVNGSKLFGANRTTTNIDGYSIAADGSLKYMASTNYAQFNPNNCGAVGPLFSDLTGTNVYALNFNGDCANNTYQSYSIHQTTGALNYLGTANGGAGSFSGVYLPLTFIGGDHWGYEATNNSCMYYGVWAFHRENGLLSSSSASTTLPAPPAGYRIYIPMMTAADPTNHVAIAMQAANPPGCSGASTQIASFSADTNGNLTTTNTSATMPNTAINNVSDLKISPAGDLIAIAGQEGLQVLHFNGSKPPTSFTGLVATDPITQMFWDKYGHLYAISQSAGLLHVYNATASEGVHEAPGSPYPIAAPASLTLQVH